MAHVISIFQKVFCNHIWLNKLKCVWDAGYFGENYHQLRRLGSL